MDQDTKRWSCYTATPGETLDILERSRARCPVAHSDEHDGFHMLLNHGDVKRAMGDHRTFSSEPQVLRPMLPRKPVPALEMDPPRHTEWRALFARAITPKTPSQLEPFVRTDVNRHIDAFLQRGSCDIVRELCEPVPAETICRLVGVDEALVPAVRRTALAMFAAQGDPEAFGCRQAEFAAVTVAEVVSRRTRPRADFLTQLATMEVEGRPLDENDYVVLMAAFLGAGHHSTTSAMASLIREVFGDARVRDALAADPTQIVPAVEETLRLHPPFFGFYRRTTCPVTVAGVDIPPNRDVYMGWAAANRDPAAFDSPGAFRLDRGVNRHLSFGFGIHTCPGAAIARMELRVVLEVLLRRLPDLALDGPAPPYQFGGGDYSFIPRLDVKFSTTPAPAGRSEEHA